MKKLPRIVLLALTALVPVLAGCNLGVDVSAAARSSFTSFLNTLATSAISSAMNPGE